MPQTRVRWGLIGAVATLTAYALGAVISWAPQLLDSWDSAGVQAAAQLSARHRPVQVAALVWSDLSRPVMVHVGVVLVAVGVRWRRQQVVAAWWLAAALLAGWGVIALTRRVIGRDRPVIADPLALAEGPSYPSGHVANITYALLLVALVLWPVISRRARLAGAVAAVVSVVVTMADRLLLGVHFPTDVVGGVVLGVGYALLAYAVWPPTGAFGPPVARRPSRP